MARIAGIDLPKNKRSVVGLTYMKKPSPTWRWLLVHCACRAFSFARDRAGSNMAARIAIIASTTANSIKVKPLDFIVPPRWDRRTNWNASVLLTLAASRMLAMKRDVETAWRIVRSARAIVQLEKPIERVAEAAHLSIIESLDPISVEALTEWIETGRSSFVDHIAKQWRLRRDAGV